MITMDVLDRSSAEQEPIAVPVELVDMSHTPLGEPPTVDEVRAGLEALDVEARKSTRLALAAAGALLHHMAVRELVDNKSVQHVSVPEVVLSPAIVGAESVAAMNQVRRRESVTTVPHPTNENERLIVSVRA